MRTTGATDAQIEAAIERLPKGGHLKWCADRYDLIQAAPYLVRPDQRIVDVADLRALVELAMTSKWSAGNHSIIDRITALLE